MNYLSIIYSFSSVFFFFFNRNMYFFEIKLSLLKKRLKRHANKSTRKKKYQLIRKNFSTSFRCWRNVVKKCKLFVIFFFDYIHFIFFFRRWSYHFSFRKTSIQIHIVDNKFGREFKNHVMLQRINRYNFIWIFIYYVFQNFNRLLHKVDKTIKINKNQKCRRDNCSIDGRIRFLTYSVAITIHFLTKTSKVFKISSSSTSKFLILRTNRLIDCFNVFEICSS